MFRHLVLLVFVAAVQADLQLQYHPQQTYVYNYETVFLSGLPENSKIFSAMKLKAHVLISRENTTPGLTKLQLRNVTFHVLNDVIFRLQALSTVLPDDLFQKLLTSEVRIIREQLQKPILFNYLAGQVTNFRAQKTDPHWSRNVKRGIISILQVKLIQIKSSLPTAFLEASVVGICKTHYMRRPSPSPNVVNIVKSRDYSSCINQPTVLTSMIVDSQHPGCSAQTRKTLGSTSTAFYKIGTNAEGSSEVIIQSALVETKHYFTPYSERGGNVGLIINQTLAFIEKNEMRIPDLVDAFVPQSGIVAEPVQPSEYQVSSESVHRGNSVVSQVSDLLTIYTQNTKGQARKESATTVYYLLAVLRQANEAELNTIWSQFIDARAKDQNQTKQKIFVDTLPHVGTRVATNLLIEKLQTSRVPNFISKTILVNMLAVSMKPDPESVEVFLRLIKTPELKPEDQRAVYLSVGVVGHKLVKEVQRISRTLLHLERERREAPAMEASFKKLAIEGYIRESQENKTRCLSQINNIHSILVDLLEKSPDQMQKMTALKAMGNFGFSRCNSSILKYALDTSVPKPVRVQAILALRRIPCQIESPICRNVLPVFWNKQEPAMIRIAVFQLITKMKSSCQLLTLIAGSLPQETNRQVALYLYSYLKEIAVSTQPCMENLAQCARKALQFAESYEPDTSSKVTWSLPSVAKHFSTFSSPLQMGAAVDLQTVISPDNYLEKFSAKMNSFIFGQSLDVIEIDIDAVKLNEALKLPALARLFRHHSTHTSSMDPRNYVKSEDPTLSLKLFGNELTFMKWSEIIESPKSGEEQQKSKVDCSQNTSFTKEFHISKNENAHRVLADITKSLIPVNVELQVPTEAGLYMKLSMTGSSVLKLKADVSLEGKRLDDIKKNMHGTVTASVASDFTGLVVVDGIYVRSGIGVYGIAQAGKPVAFSFQVKNNKSQNSIVLRMPVSQKSEEVMASAHVSPFTLLEVLPKRSAAATYSKAFSLTREIPATINSVAGAFNKTLGLETIGVGVSVHGVLTSRNFLHQCAFFPLTGRQVLSVSLIKDDPAPKAVEVEVLTHPCAYPKRGVTAKAVLRGLWPGSSRKAHVNVTFCQHCQDEKFQMNALVLGVIERKAQTPLKIKIECDTAVPSQRPIRPVCLFNTTYQRRVQKALASADVADVYPWLLASWYHTLLDRTAKVWQSWSSIGGFGESRYDAFEDFVTRLASRPEEKIGALKKVESIFRIQTLSSSTIRSLIQQCASPECVDRNTDIITNLVSNVSATGKKINEVLVEHQKATPRLPLVQNQTLHLLLRLVAMKQITMVEQLKHIIETTLFVASRTDQAARNLANIKSSEEKFMQRTIYHQIRDIKSVNRYLDTEILRQIERKRVYNSAMKVEAVVVRIFKDSPASFKKDMAVLDEKLSALIGKLPELYTQPRNQVRFAIKKLYQITYEILQVFYHISYRSSSTQHEIDILISKIIPKLWQITGECRLFNTVDLELNITRQQLNNLDSKALEVYKKLQQLEESIFDTAANYRRMVQEMVAVRTPIDRTVENIKNSISVIETAQSYLKKQQDQLLHIVQKSGSLIMASKIYELLAQQYQVLSQIKEGFSLIFYEQKHNSQLPIPVRELRRRMWESQKQLESLFQVYGVQNIYKQISTPPDQTHMQMFKQVAETENRQVECDTQLSQASGEVKITFDNQQEPAILAKVQLKKSPEQLLWEFQQASPSTRDDLSKKLLVNIEKGIYESPESRNITVQLNMYRSHHVDVIYKENIPYWFRNVLLNYRELIKHDLYEHLAIDKYTTEPHENRVRIVTQFRRNDKQMDAKISTHSEVNNFVGVNTSPMCIPFVTGKCYPYYGITPVNTCPHQTTTNFMESYVSTEAVNVKHLFESEISVNSEPSSPQIGPTSPEPSTAETEPTSPQMWMLVNRESSTLQTEPSSPESEPSTPETEPTSPQMWMLVNRESSTLQTEPSSPESEPSTSETEPTSPQMWMLANRESSTLQTEPSSPESEPSTPETEPTSPQMWMLVNRKSSTTLTEPSSPESEPSTPQTEPTSPQMWMLVNRESSTLQTEPSSPESEPSTPQTEPTSPQMWMLVNRESSTLQTEPSSPESEPSTPQTEPTSPQMWMLVNRESSTLQTEPSSPESEPSTPQTEPTSPQMWMLVNRESSTLQTEPSSPESEPSTPQTEPTSPQMWMLVNRESSTLQTEPSSPESEPSTPQTEPTSPQMWMLVNRESSTLQTEPSSPESEPSTPETEPTSPQMWMLVNRESSTTLTEPSSPESEPSTPQTEPTSPQMWMLVNRESSTLQTEPSSPESEPSTPQTEPTSPQMWMLANRESSTLQTEPSSPESEPSTPETEPTSPQMWMLVNRESSTTLTEPSSPESEPSTPQTEPTSPQMWMLVNRESSTLQTEPSSPESEPSTPQTEPTSPQMWMLVNRESSTTLTEPSSPESEPSTPQTEPTSPQMWMLVNRESSTLQTEPSSPETEPSTPETEPTSPQMWMLVNRESSTTLTEPSSPESEPSTPQTEPTSPQMWMLVNRESSTLQTEPSSPESEPSTPETEPTSPQMWMLVNRESSTLQTEPSSPESEPSTPETEPTSPQMWMLVNRESSTTLTEPSSPESEPSTPQTEPTSPQMWMLVNRESSTLQTEPSSPESEPSTPETEPTSPQMWMLVNRESSTLQTEPSSPESEPSTPETESTSPHMWMLVNRESSTLQTEPSSPESEPSTPQTEPTSPHMWMLANKEFSSPQTEPSFAETEPSTPETEPTSPQMWMLVNRESSTLQTEPSSPESDPSTPQTEPTSPQMWMLVNRESSTLQTEPSSPESEPSTPETEPTSPQMWMLANKESSTTLTEPSYAETEPSTPETEPTSPQMWMLANRESSTLQTEPSSPESEPSTPETEPTSPQMWMLVNRESSTTLTEPSSPESEPSTPQTEPTSPQMWMLVNRESSTTLTEPSSPESEPSTPQTEPTSPQMWMLVNRESSTTLTEPSSPESEPSTPQTEPTSPQMWMLVNRESSTTLTEPSSPESEPSTPQTEPTSPQMWMLVNRESSTTLTEPSSLESEPSTPQTEPTSPQMWMLANRESSTLQTEPSSPESEPSTPETETTPPHMWMLENKESYTQQTEPSSLETETSTQTESSSSESEPSTPQTESTSPQMWMLVNRESSTPQTELSSPESKPASFQVWMSGSSESSTPESEVSVPDNEATLAQMWMLTDKESSTLQTVSSVESDASTPQTEPSTAQTELTSPQMWMLAGIASSTPQREPSTPQINQTSSQMWLAKTGLTSRTEFSTSKTLVTSTQKSMFLNRESNLETKISTPQTEPSTEYTRSSSYVTPSTSPAETNTGSNPHNDKL